jgi:hypothetical protein
MRLEGQFQRADLRRTSLVGKFWAIFFSAFAVICVAL